jgi:hypothetical protein
VEFLQNGHQTSPTAAPEASHDEVEGMRRAL